MKTLIILLVLITLGSCGKKDGNKSSSSEANTNKIQTINLANQTFSQDTLNGESKLTFYDIDLGEIEIYLHYLDSDPLKTKYDYPVSTTLRFKKYTFIEEDVLELEDVSLDSTFVPYCGTCNSKELKERIRYHYADLFNGKDSIKVKLMKINGNNHFFLLKLGPYLL